MGRCVSNFFWVLSFCLVNEYEDDANWRVTSTIEQGICR